MIAFTISKTTEIPRVEWRSFLDGFSRHHQGWIVTLEIFGERIGDQQAASGLPLVGMGADDGGATSRVFVMLGGRPEHHLTHFIESATRMWWRQSDEPAYDAVAVEADGGIVNVVYFQHVPIEAVDRQLPEK